MRKPLTAVLLAAALAATGAAAWAAQNPPAGAWDVYTDRVKTITCTADRPVLLKGSHTELTLTGPCRYVRLTGAHNDIMVTLVPGGTFEITGEHNDVFWTPLDPRGRRPVLLNHGYSNTFHRRTDED